MSGLFNSLKNELNSAANSISRDIDSFSKKAGDKWDEYATSPLLDNFRTGNVLQLISRSSGRSLEIVTANTGHLVVDGCGPEGPHHMHTEWTVFNEGRNIVRLHNQGNFLAIMNGAVVIQNYPDPSMTGPQTKFRLHQVGQFVSLESNVEEHRYLGVLREGQLKSAMACGREVDGQWGVRVLYTPYQNQPQPRPGAAANTTHVVQTRPGQTVVVTTTTTRKQ